MTTHDSPALPPLPEPIDRTSAQSFCAALGETVDALIRVLDEETRLVRACRFAEAAALSEEKGALAGRYGRAHGMMKHASAEIGRQAPVELEELRRRHEALETATADNLAVLATARTVSETLIRSVAETAAQGTAAPSAYSADAKESETRRPRPLSLDVAL